MTPWGPPPSAHVGRVALRVAALEDQTQFYRDIIGLSVISRDEDRVTLGVDDQALLELLAVPDAPERDRREAGLFHVAFRVPTRSALGEALYRVETDPSPSASLTGASNHLVSEALYLRDPEGNGVEVYRDTPREEWPTSGDEVRMETHPLDLASLRSERRSPEKAAVPEANGSDSVPSETIVGHVHLDVIDLNETRTFYVDRLGLRLRQQFGADAMFFAAGSYHHHVGANTWQGCSQPQGPDRRGIAWFEIVVPDTADCAAARERFGSEWDLRDIEDGFVIRDPNGINVRVVATETDRN